MIDLHITYPESKSKEKIIMDMDVFHTFQLNLISALHSIREPWLDSFMIFANNLDTLIFYVTLIIVIWYGYNRKLGIELFYLLLLSAIITMDVKELFDYPPFSIKAGTWVN